MEVFSFLFRMNFLSECNIANHLVRNSFPLNSNFRRFKFETANSSYRVEREYCGYWCSKRDADECSFPSKRILLPCEIQVCILALLSGWQLEFRTSLGTAWKLLMWSFSCCHFVSNRLWFVNFHLQMTIKPLSRLLFLFEQVQSFCFHLGGWCFLQDASRNFCA